LTKQLIVKSPKDLPLHLKKFFSVMEILLVPQRFKLALKSFSPLDQFFILQQPTCDAWSVSWLDPLYFIQVVRCAVKTCSHLEHFYVLLQWWNCWSRWCFQTTQYIRFE